MLLGNDFLEAAFCSETGNLRGLSTPAGPDLLAGWFCHFLDGQALVSEDPAEEAATRFEVVNVASSEDAVESTIRANAIQIRRRFHLDYSFPLLHVTYEVKGTGRVQAVQHLGLPMVTFPGDFVDAFEDTEDLYFDGAEWGDGRQLPCWRVFFREGHRDGLMVVGRSRIEMSHLQIYDRGFDVRPHVMTAYDTDYVLAHGPVVPDLLQGDDLRVN